MSSILKKSARILVLVLAATICYTLNSYAPVFAEKWVSSFFAYGATPAPLWVSSILSCMYAFFILTVCFPFLLIVGWMFLADRKGRYGSKVPFVSIIIPAFNEEQAILRSLEALNLIEYPSFEVIVVNDGSTDFTFSVIERARVKCIHLRENQGKSAALNAGIAEAKGDIIVFSDSDSWLHPMALRHLIQGFSSSKVGAVSGTVDIAYANNMLRRWQAIEYTFGQFFVKEAQIGSGASVAICPGPVCAFSREAIQKIGGYSSRTITEDFDATLEVIKAGYDVNYSPRAIAYTEAPDTWQSLKKQRLRWFRGHIQTFRLQKELFFSPKTGALGFFWLPIYYLFFGYLCGAIEFALIPIIAILFLGSGSGLAMLQVTTFYIFFGLFFVTLGYGIVLLHSKLFTWPLLLAACLIYPYLFYLNWLRLLAVYNEIKGKAATWSG